MKALPTVPPKRKIRSNGATTRSWSLLTAKVAGKPTEGTPNHFEKMLEGPCPNHAFPAKHLYKDYGLKYLAGGLNKGEQGKEPVPTTDDAEEKDDAFPTLNGALMIFKG